MKGARAKGIPALLADLVCCLLGSCAFCSALLPALGQEVSLGDCLLLAAIDLSLLFLLSRRWWLTPLLAAAAALLGLAVVHFFHLREPLSAYLEGFLQWYRAAYPYTLPYSENGSLFFIHLLFSFPVTLLLYLFFRRLPLLPIWVLLGGGLLYWMYYSGAEGLLPVTALLLAVALVLLARTNTGSVNRKLDPAERVPPAAAQLTALALAPLVLLFTFALAPKEDGAWQSRSLVNIIADLQDIIYFYGDGSSGGGSFDLSYSGLSPHGGVLGGDIDPNNRSVMRVKTSSPILLAGAVYESYDGYGWYDSGALGHFRLSSPFWRGKRREVFTIDKPDAGKTAASYYGKVSKTAVLEVSLSVRFRSLFSEGKVEELRLPGGDESSVYFNKQGELYTLDFPATGTSYTVRTRVFAREKPDFDENMRRLLAFAASTRDKEYDDIRQRCTAVPDTVEPFVRELALEITRDCGSAYDKALAIEKWLGENCSYTKTPGDAPAERDFVSAFLEQREGYCTYYASAMTLLARLAGLPARYVTGYGLKQADKKPGTTAYVATNATAHAWTQVYFYGVGWMDFDPMNWNFYEPAELDVPVIRDPPPELPVPTPEIPTPEPEQPELPEKEASSPLLSSQGRKTGTGRVLLLILGCDLGALLLFLLLRFALLFFRAENYFYRLLRRYPDLAAGADACYRQLLKQLRFLGLTPEPPDTITGFCRRVDAVLGRDAGPDSMESVCEPVLLSRFAGRTPTEGELRRMCDYSIFLEGELRRKLGLRKYLLRRMLLGR